MVGIELRGVTKTFDTPTGLLHAVNDVWLCVEEGSIHGIIGLSGAGKSTLLRLINLIERPDSGEVVVDGRELTGLSEEEVRHARRGIGMIFQHFNLLAKRDAYPAKLSGGEKQRVAIARALATQPRILLCDEPTSSVDPQTKGTILGYLREINRRFGITIVLVTHEMSVVRAVCDVVTVLDRGRSVEQFAPNDHLHRPRSAIASFLARSEIVLEPLGDDASVAVAGGE